MLDKGKGQTMSCSRASHLRRLEEALVEMTLCHVGHAPLHSSALLGLTGLQT